MEPEEVRRRTGGTLRRILADAGVSQADLGAALGRSQKAVSGYINGTRLMSIAQALGIDRALEWQPGDFLLEAAVISPSVARIIANDDGLDDTAREALTGDYDRRLAETAERRRAALTGRTPADPAPSARTVRLDGVSADPQLVALFIANMIGTDALPIVAGQLALIASGTPNAESAPDGTSTAQGAPAGDTA